MPIEEFLDLARGNVLAPANDDVPAAANNLAIAILV